MRHAHETTRWLSSWRARGPWGPARARRMGAGTGAGAAPGGRLVEVLVGAVLACGVLGGCAALDAGRQGVALKRDRLDHLERYDIERAELAARQEREHARMELRHASEVSALDAALIAALNSSGRDLQELEVRHAAERRVFLADARARLELIDARAKQLVLALEIDDGVVQQLEELGVRRAAIEVGLHALDLIEDGRWFEARRVVSREIGALARSVEELDDGAADAGPGAD